MKKLGRNDRCHCGSGKKYKQCHLDLDRQLAQAEANREFDTAGISHRPVRPTDMLATLEGLKTLAPEMGPNFASALHEVEPLIEYAKRQPEIEAAGRALIARREEFARFATDEKPYLDRTTALFAEDRFSALRFTPSDVRRAFQAVGLPTQATPAHVLLAEKLPAAILHLADENLRRRHAMALLSIMSDLFAEGRHLDAWIVQQCACLTVELPQESNPFLFAMFAHGYDAWVAENEARHKSALREFGYDIDALARKSPEEIEAWFASKRADPAENAKLAAFFQSHPELEADSIAMIDATERDSLLLFRQPGAESLLLSENEIEPWLEPLNQLLTDLANSLPEEAPVDQPNEQRAQHLYDALDPLLREMAEKIFTPSRLQTLRADLRKFAGEKSAGGERAIARFAYGAITALEARQDPSDNYFLIALCHASLMHAFRPPEPGEET